MEMDPIQGPKIQQSYPGETDWLSLPVREQSLLANTGTNLPNTYKEHKSLVNMAVKDWLSSLSIEHESVPVLLASTKGKYLANQMGSTPPYPKYMVENIDKTHPIRPSVVNPQFVDQS
jgi:hypothetical protein